MSEVVQSFSFDQHQILKDIIALHVPEGIECDMTYGNGAFWNGIPKPRYCYDLDPDCDAETCSSTELPHANGELSSAIFDPPFLTYIRQNREGNGDMALARRFSGYWTYDELKDHYIETLHEAARILKPRGIFIVKCQDIIHNHKMHCTHANVIQWAQWAGFRLKDLFVLAAKHRMPSPQKGQQRHARIFHCYFLVFERLKQVPSCPSENQPEGGC